MKVMGWGVSTCDNFCSFSIVKKSKFAVKGYKMSFIFFFATMRKTKIENLTEEENSQPRIYNTKF